MRFAQKIAFDRVWVKGHEQLKALNHGRVLVVSNHLSWWDGFILESLFHQTHSKTPLLIPMIEREYVKRRWMRFIGVCGLNPETPRSFLGLCRRIQFARKKNLSLLTLFFPQGRITPSFARPLGFQRGVELLIQADPSLIIVPCALHIEPMNTLRPWIFAQLGVPRHCSTLENAASTLELAVQSQLSELQETLGIEADRVETQLKQDQRWTLL